MSIGERIRKERERCKMTQPEFGALAGVTKTSQINYEKGTRSPDANYLAAIAKAGVDISYIITGQEALTQSALDQELANFASAWEAIEKELERQGKTLPPSKKRQAAEALYQAVRTGEGELKGLSKMLAKVA